MNILDPIPSLNYKSKTEFSGPSAHLRVEPKEPGGDKEEPSPQENQHKQPSGALNFSKQPLPDFTENPSTRYDATGKLIKVDLGPSLTI